MISSMPGEPMHSFDGGTLKTTMLKCLEKRWRGEGVITLTGRAIIDKRIVEERKSWIDDPARYLRFLHFINTINHFPHFTWLNIL
jgi:hypothetical protein